MLLETSTSVSVNENHLQSQPAMPADSYAMYYHPQVRNTPRAGNGWKSFLHGICMLYHGTILLVVSTYTLRNESELAGFSTPAASVFLRSVFTAGQTLSSGWLSTVGSRSGTENPKCRIVKGYQTDRLSAALTKTHDQIASILISFELCENQNAPTTDSQQSPRQCAGFPMSKLQRDSAWKLAGPYSRVR